MEHVNRNLLKEDIEKLRDELVLLQGKDDVKHLNSIVVVSNTLTFVGIATLWLPWYYIFPSISLSTGLFAKWLMLAHHVCHGGYDYTKDTRYNRFRYAIGSIKNRFEDWFDWILPEAWTLEHNLHHYNLGEVKDPDLIEQHSIPLREGKTPLSLKYIIVLLLAATWKWYYLGIHFYRVYYIQKIDRTQLKRSEIASAFTLRDMLMDMYNDDVKPWSKHIFSVMMPYFTFTFVLLPMLWGIAFHVLFGDGRASFTNCIFNVILAEIFTNMHAFICIVPNHSGNDLYRFETPCIPRSGEFYLRQIISTTNFSAGTDLVDFLHGFLNYQIEHHLFPNLSMLSYRRAMPEVKRICKVSVFLYSTTSNFLVKLSIVL